MPRTTRANGSPDSAAPARGGSGAASTATARSVTRSATRSALGSEGLSLSPEAFERLRDSVPRVALETVETIMAEVPAYARPFSEAMGERITVAVELALVNFLELARVGRGADPAEPIAPSTAAAYDLGRGEARSGRSLDALQAAYRVGGRVSWRGLSREAVAMDVPGPTLAAFAELVFAYIDALSAASVAGHADELAMAGRARERYRERLAGLLLRGANERELVAAARRAEWAPTRTLTAVLLPEGQARAVLGTLDARVLASTTDAGADGDQERGGDGLGVLLVPDASGRDRDRLLRQLDGRGAVVGPDRPWTQVGRSYARAARARAELPAPPDGAPLNTEDHLVELLLGADPEMLADLRTRALGPLAGVRPTVRARLEETLRSWVLHHGRRELMAAHLYVHPQTVRYRMGKLRELFGDRLDDPDEVLRLTLALAGQPRAPR